MRRYGVVLITILVAIGISLTLFGLWAKSTVGEHRRSANQQLRLQASRLAEAGLRRAMAQHAANPQYREETWTVPAEQLGGAHAASVKLRAMPINDQATLRFEATAEFPLGAVRRAQVTTTIDVPNTHSENEP